MAAAAAASCSTCMIKGLINLNNISNNTCYQNNNNNNNNNNIIIIGECSFLRPSSGRPLCYLQRSATTRSNDRCSNSNKNKNMKREYSVIRKATPEISAAGDVLSTVSNSFPTIPGFSFPGDNPWITAFAGLFLVVPFAVQRLLALSKQVDMAAEAVEAIADTVGKVAEGVDKAAEEFAESLPEGGLKKMAELVEDIAEETVKDAQVVEDLMDKVEELDDKLEALINKQKSKS